MKSDPEAVPLSQILIKHAQIVRFTMLNEEVFPGGGSDTDSSHPESIDGKSITLEQTDEIIADLLSPDSKYRTIHNLTDKDIIEIETDVTNSETLYKFAGLGFSDALMEFDLVCDFMWGDRKDEEPVPVEVQKQLRGDIYRTGMKVTYQGQEYIVCRLDASSEHYRMEHENHNLCLEEGDVIPEDAIFHELKVICARFIDTDE